MGSWSNGYDAAFAIYETGGDFGFKLGNQKFSFETKIFADSKTVCKKSTEGRFFVFNESPDESINIVT